MLCLDGQHDPVRLTEHLRGTHECAGWMRGVTGLFGNVTRSARALQHSRPFLDIHASPQGVAATYSCVLG